MSSSNGVAGLAGVSFACLGALFGCAGPSLPSGAWPYYDNYSKALHYRAFACTAQNPSSGWACGTSAGEYTVKSAIKMAVKKCDEARSAYEINRPCRLVMIGDTDVHGLNDEQLDEAIARYAKLVGRKIPIPDESKFVECKFPDGFIILTTPDACGNAQGQVQRPQTK